MSPTLITFENVQLGIKCSNLHLCPGLHAAAKIAIFRVLRKIASLTFFALVVIFRSSVSR